MTTLENLNGEGDTPAAKAAIGDRRDSATPREILDACAEHFGIPLEVLRGSGRTKLVAHARHVAMYLCREIAGMSLSEVAAHLGGKSTSSVSHAIHSVIDDLGRSDHRTLVALDGVRELLSTSSQRCDAPGLVAVYNDIAEQRPFFSGFESARWLDLALVTGRNVIGDYIEALERAIRNNACRVRVVLADPGGIVAQAASASSLCPNIDLPSAIVRTARELGDLRERLGWPDSLEGSLLEVRFRRSSPVCNILIQDNVDALVTNFIPYQHTSTVPTYHYRHGAKSQFSQYRTAFEKIWAEPNRTLDDVLDTHLQSGIPSIDDEQPV